MSDYVLSCCSTADVTRAWLEDRDIKYLYFNYYLNGEACKDDLASPTPPPSSTPRCSPALTPRPRW